MLHTELIPFIERFREANVLVIGDAMVDEYLWGDARRICPEAPVPVIEEVRRSSAPGGMANVAINAVRLGARVWVVGAVGDDAQGEHLRGMLTQRGVDTTGLISDPARPTSTKTRIIAQNQQVVRIDRENASAISPEVSAVLLEQCRERLPLVDVCVLSDYAKGVLGETLTQALISLGHECGLPIVVDPKGSDYRRYRKATVVTPNLQEARLACMHERQPPDDIVALGETLLDVLPESALLITRGADGVALFRENHGPWYICLLPPVKSTMSPAPEIRSSQRWQSQ
jgi:D-beta-D-heptose 7-phosphate kinase/D-beta-D-heptose 1-phosphate adenosyltransferase